MVKLITSLFLLIIAGFILLLGHLFPILAIIAGSWIIYQISPEIFWLILAAVFILWGLKKLAGSAS